MLSARGWFALPVVVLAAVIGACSGGPPSSGSSAAAATGPADPQVVIQSPPGNAQVVVSQPVEVVTAAVDGLGIARIDLRVDDAAVSSAEAPPGGLTSFAAVHRWVPSVTGQVTLSAIAFRTDGAPSAPMSIEVLVLAAGSSPAPYPTFDGPRPTWVAVQVESDYPPPTYVAHPTHVAMASPTKPPVATPTDHAQATPTEAVATPSYEATPTAATATPTTGPTTAPSTQVLAWKIPFKGGAAALSDSVATPGDVDRVNYEVTGLSATPPGNTAFLTIFGSCTGTGTESVRFLYGQSSFPCNTQFVTNLLVTSDSDTGAVRVTVIGSTPVNVTWTLTGQATP